MSDSLLNRSYKQLEENISEKKILILGDSHIANGLNTTILKDSFNYASVSETYVQTYYKLKSLLKRDDQNIELVILQFDLHTFFDKYNKDQNLYFWSRFIDPFEIKTIYNWTWSETIFYKIKTIFFSYVSGLMNISENLQRKGDTGSKLIDGFQPLYKKLNLKRPKEIFLKQRVHQHFLKHGKPIAKVNLSYFFKILDLLQQNNIEVALISMPLSKEYYAYAKNYLAFKDFKKLLDITRKNFPNLKQYYNYRMSFLDSPEFYEKDSLFNDYDHLNINGTIKLGKNLCRRLQEDFNFCR